jgi:hypothetical protein
MIGQLKPLPLGKGFFGISSTVLVQVRLKEHLPHPQHTFQALRTKSVLPQCVGMGHLQYASEPRPSAGSC